MYRIEVALAGLTPMVREHVPLKQNEVARVQVTLRLEVIETVTVGALDVEAMMTDGMSTTFSQDFLNSLPIEH